MAWVNGRSIGRYWLIEAVDLDIDPFARGIALHLGSGEPTQRFYHLPDAWLADENELVLFEETAARPDSVAVALPA